MTTTVTLFDIKPTDVMTIVGELKSQGHKQGTDFDFFYHPAEISSFSNDAPNRRSTDFVFYTEKLATFFALKYSQ